MNLNFLNKIKQKFKSGAKKAFSLNDLSILVSTAAIVVVSSVAISNIKVSNTKQKLDAEKIEAIYNNIGKFLLTNKRLPCPAGIKRIRGKDANYALESFNSSTGACNIDEIGGVYNVNNVNSNLIYGAVPALNLGLDSEFAEDQYGSKIIYVIDKRAANRYSAEIGSGNVNIGSIQDASIIVKEDAVNVSSDSIFAIITVGKNKLGGFNANSSTSNTLPTDSYEQQNSFASISGPVIAMDNIFQKSIKDNTVFDDIVFFANRKSLIADFKADFLIPCTGADTTKYSSSTASFGQILYAKNNCVAPYANLTPATKCEKDGKWVSYTSCPCYLKIDTGEVKEEWVPNGQRTAKCLTEKGYDGVLKYTCNEDSSLSIPAIDSKDRCQKRCNTTGIVGLKNASIPDGVTSLNCDEENYQGNVVLTCENGIVKNPIIGSCKISTCNIGGYSGMLLGTYPSGTLGASGVCDTANGYTGSYKCDCIDGESKVYDECFKNCTFSTLGITEVSLNHGNHTINCDANYLGGPVSVNCNDGTAIIKSGKCYKNGECSVGNGTGMIPLSVPFNTSLKTNGQCLEGYQGSYSYSCSIEGVAQVTNNCNKILKCIFSESKQRSMLVDGMLPKDLDVGTSGNGECIPGYGGFYKWSCSANAVGSITEDNCEKSCKIGGTIGIAEATVDYGKTGENICDIVNGYAGTYTWSCAEDADKKVVGAITNNSCFNTCFVGTPIQGTGMYQKSVILNTSGIDGTCSPGYVGSYSWKCEKNGYSSVVNNCKNTCRVGVGTGMTEKNVAIPYCTGANCPALISDNTGAGLCDSNKGYTGSYNWTCNASGVGNSVNGCVLRSCTIYDAINRNSKTSSAGLAGKDGTCKDGYFGSYTWGCSFQGVGSIISDDCQAVTCSVSSGVNGFSAGTTVAYGTNDYYCNATGYRTDLTARFRCEATGTGTVGTLSQVSGMNYCDKVRCTIPSNSNTTIAGTSVDFTTTISSLTCKPGFSGDPKYTCTGTGAVGSYNPSGTSCTQNSCTVSAGTGYASRPGLGANSFSCDAGFSGTINYVCDGATNAKITGTCDPISCTISGTGFNSKSLSGSGTSNCDAGFAGSFSYACTGLSTATVTNNTCTAIKCSSTAYNGLSTSVLTNLAFAPANSPGSVTCDQAGYTGTASYTCTGITNPGEFSITSACACSNGFESLSGSCGAIQCTTSIAGFQANTPINYSAASSNYYYCNDPIYNNFITTTFPACTTSKILSPTSSCVKISCSTASLNTNTTSIFIGTGQNLSCAEGYYSASGVTTDCVAVYAKRADNVMVPNTGALANILGTCARIKCTIPAGSNLTLGDGSQVDFTGNTATSLSCKSGFVSSLGATNPSYTCTATGSSTTGSYKQNGICNPITCTSSGNGYLTQTGLAFTATAGTGVINCTQTGYTGTANYTCQASGAASITKTCDCDATNGYSRNSSAEACVKVQCSIPAGYNLTVATGSKVDFTTGSNTGSINCASGFYNSSNLSNSVTYTCKIGTGTTGNYEQTGQCVAVTCPYGLYSYLANETTAMNIVSQYGLIKEIKFASYGTPYGDPWKYYTSSCHSSVSNSVIQSACLNNASCTVNSNNTTFGDPCGGTVKRLIVQYRYEIPGITGITSVDFGNNFLTCGNGYSGTVNYNCDQNRLMSITGGTCNPIKCSSSGNGYPNQTSLDYATPSAPGNIACNASIAYSGNANYTCQTQGAVATITKTCDCASGYTKDANGACVAIKCSSIGNGYSDQTALSYTPDTTNGAIICNQTGYTGYANYTCKAQGSATITKVCDCDTGYSKNIYGVCEKVQCLVPNGSNLTIADGTSLDFIVSGTLNCKSGFLTSTNSNSVSYSCSVGSGGAIGNYSQSALCNPIKCSSSGNGYPNQTSLSYATALAPGTINCSITGYSGSINYTCTTNGTANLTSTCACDSANGYARNTPADACARIQCSVPSSANANETSVNFTNSGSLTCKTGFVSSLGATAPTYKCLSGSGTTGTYSPLAGTCDAITCKVPAGIKGFIAETPGIKFGSGYYNCNAPGYFTTNTATFNCGVNGTSSTGLFSQVASENYCTAISCTISGNGFTSKSLSGSGTSTCDAGYSGSFSYTCTGATTATITNNTCTIISCTISGTGFNSKSLSGSGTSNCDAGFAGSFSYACTGLSTATVTNNTCTAIKCSSTAYNGLSTSVLTNLNFTPGISTGTVTCDQAGYAGTASYTCTGTSNPGTFNITSACNCADGFETISGSCGTIQCLTSIEGFQTNTPINYSSASSNYYYCNDPKYNNFITTTFPACTTSKILSPTSSCVKITCSTASLNVTQSSLFIGNNQSLTCASGYYSPSTVTTNCVAVYAIRSADGASVPNTGTLSNTLGNCARIKCTIPASSNLTLSTGTQVDFSSSAVGLNCASGFVSSLGATNPSYTCTATGSSATGSYNQNGICNPITCVVPTGVTGFVAGTTEIQFGSGNYNCNAPGYYTNNTATFNCAVNGTSSTGLFSFSASTNYCQAIPCTISGTGFTSKSLSGSGTSSCDAGYSGSFSYTCTGATTATITNNTCAIINCPISAGFGYIARSGSGVNSFLCDAGFTGTINYTCTSSTTSTTSGTCNPITCTSSGNGYPNQTGLIYTASPGAGLITCNQPGYNGNANYTCQTSGVALITSTCNCATGYVKNGLGVCVNSCVIPASTGTTQITTTALNVTGNGTCASGYSGYFSFSCSSAGVGAVTLNNCYQGTFTEKLFTYTTSSQTVSGSPGGNYGLTWPDILTLSLPADYLYTSRVQMINGFYYSCGGYGTYHNAGISKTSGFGATGGIIGSYCEPQPGYYSTSCNAGPQLMAPGIELRNGDVLRFSTSNYTGCGYSSAYFTLNLYYMAKASCTVGGSGGSVSKVVIGGSSGTDGACQAGYSGSYNWSCDNNGVSTVTNNTCAIINCPISAGTGFIARSGSGSNSFPCDAGFTGTINYTCNSSTTSTTSGTCTPITCTSSGNGYLTQSSLGYTVTPGTGVIACNQTGYTGNANYTCQTSGVALITSTCNCATGYTKNANGACVSASNTFTPNWYDSASAPAGVYVTTSSNNSIGMAGPNGTPPDSWGFYLANLPSWVTKVSFNWSYYANDYGDYDRGYFFVNGGWQYLTNNNCTGCSSSGTITNLAINPAVQDRRFGPGVWTRDGCCGAGFLTLSNIVVE